MPVSPVLIAQIEKFHCLNPSTPQGLSTGNLRLHVATCLKTCLKVFQLWHEITQKTRIIWFNCQWCLLVYPLSLQPSNFPHCLSSVGKCVPLSMLRSGITVLTLLLWRSQPAKQAYFICFPQQSSTDYIYHLSWTWQAIKIREVAEAAC